MKKIFFLFILSYFVFFSFSNDFKYDIERLSFNYKPGIYNFDIILDVKPLDNSDTLYYIYNDDLRNSDPIILNKSLYLNGEDGFKKEFIIKLLIINKFSKIDIIDVKYTIDKTFTYKIDEQNEENDYLIDNNISYNKFEYTTHKNNIYYSFDNIIDISNLKTDKKIEVDYKKDKSVFIGYKDNDNLIINYISNNLTKPDLGFIKWGKVLAQNIKINIKNPNSSGEIFYWFKEFSANDILLGPPSDLNKWNLFQNNIEINTNDYTKIYSISSYIKKDNFYSEISGPYYFKIDNSSNEVQFIENISNNDSIEKVVQDNYFSLYINDQLIDNKYLSVNSNKIKILIIDKTNKKYSINFYNKTNQGKILNISNKEFYIVSSDKENTIEIYNEDNLLVNKVKFGNSIDNIPTIVDYNSEYIESYNNLKLNFYKPLTDNGFIIRILDKERNLISEINDLANDLDLNNDKDVNIEIIKNNKLLKKYFVSFLNNTSSLLDGISVNIDSNKTYNSELQIIFKNIPQRYKLLYSYDNINFFNFRNYVLLTPPNGVISNIKIYYKIVDSLGNISDTVKELNYNFDTRAIFVDSNFDKIGIGTIQEPVKSLEDAIRISELTKIKVINILSKENYIYKTLNINSELVIQGYNDSEVHINYLNKFNNISNIIKIKNNNYLEFRNVILNIENTKNYNIIGDNIKLLFYNCKINFLGLKTKFIYSNGSDIGFRDCLITSNISKDFQMLETTDSNIIFENIGLDLISNKIVLFFGDKCDYKLSNINIKCEVSFDKLNFFLIHNSKLDIFNLDIFVNSKNSSIILFDMINTNFISNWINITLNDKGSFDLKVINSTNCKIDLNNNQYQLDGGVNSSIFFIRSSEIDINRSIFEVKNQMDSSYNIQSYKSFIKITSSIFKTVDTPNSVNIINNNGLFEGINNTFIVDGVTDKSYNFYLSDKSSITTINSIYYNNQQKEGNNFLFYNGDLKNINIIWNKNIISNSFNLFDVNSKENYSFIQNSYNLDNNYFDNKLFDLTKKYYFIPNDLSLISNMGISNSDDFTIPKDDFFSNERNNSSYGIDLGAVQVTGLGYFE